MESVFPDPASAPADLPFMASRRLTIPLLLDAYRHGIFPWYSVGEPVLWWSPDPRAILELDELHVSRRLRQTIRSGRFEATRNEAFGAVMRGCGDRDEGTWITPDMIEAYEELHRLGHAESVEVWRDGRLAGGVYGVVSGPVFCAESMFHRERDASKVALYHLVESLRERSFDFLDAQTPSDHLIRLGFRVVSRAAFLARLRAALS